MAKPISPSHPSGVASYKNEWAALLECASPSHDPQRLRGLLRCADWARLLVLAEAHGVAGHLTACLRSLDDDLGPPEIRQTLVDRRRAQNFLTLSLTAELFRILDRFSSEGIGALVLKRPAITVRA